MEELRNYSPHILQQDGNRAYAEALIELKRCPSCGKWMVDFEGPNYWYHHMPFPAWEKITLLKQVERAGWVRTGNQKNKDNETICAICADAGKATFICALCNQERDSSDEHDSFGDPPDFLCRQCYTTIPAQTYELKEEALRDAHRYDFD